jgi:polysaccharide biosynthesis transport protein
MPPPRKTSSSRRSEEKENAPLSLDYDYLLRLCLRYWPWLVGGVVVGGLAGFLYTAFQIPIYGAKAALFVPAKDSSVPNVGEVGQSDTHSGDMLNTYVQLLQTKDLVERVVKSEHLNENPEFLPKGVTPPVSEETAAGMLTSERTIRIRPTYRLIDITVEHPSPQMAQLLANRLAQEAVLQEFDQKTASAGVLSNYLEQEVKRLQQKISESQHALQDYRASHPGGDSLDTPDDIVGTRLKDLNQQYINAQAQEALLEERYGPEHPKLIAAKKMVEELRDEVDKAQGDAQALHGLSIDYEAMKGDVAHSQSQLDNLLKALNDAQVAEHVEIPDIRVSEEAQLPYVPDSPAKKKAAAVGALIGLMCGMGFIFALYFIDSSIRSVSQAESTLNVPVIAAVPILTESEGSSVLPTYSDPHSFVAESFRGLRASLILHDREHPLKTILVVSAIPGEGKSFSAANLAVTFAQAGLKTLLIDADLRLPTLYTYFNFPAGEKNNGFPTALAGRETLASAVVASQIPGLALLLTTLAADSPAELLSGIRLPLLLEEAARQYDRIVIDSAPLNAVSDTLLIVQKVDAILLVIRASQTPANECKAAVQKIENSKMKPLGLILNYLDHHTLKSYAYGYSYGQKPKDKDARPRAKGAK